MEKHIKKEERDDSSLFNAFLIPLSVRFRCYQLNRSEMLPPELPELPQLELPLDPPFELPLDPLLLSTSDDDTSVSVSVMV